MKNTYEMELELRVYEDALTYRIKYRAFKVKAKNKLEATNEALANYDALFEDAYKVKLTKINYIEKVL